MNRSSAQTSFRVRSFACLVILISASICRAQNSVPNPAQELNQRATLERMDDANRGADRAYGEFAALKPHDVDKKIKLGRAFLSDYPTSQYAEPVAVSLTNAYYERQDWTNFFATADRALALSPDEADVLLTVSWVTPHVLNPNAPDAAKQLDKAESYAKRAIPLLAKLPKPAGMSDAQYDDFKNNKLIQAHSALGLVYFRRHDFENSVKELEQSTQGNASPDPTDLYVLGMSLENLGRYREAMDAYNRCSQISGGPQDQCKQRSVGVQGKLAQK